MTSDLVGLLHDPKRTRHEVLENDTDVGYCEVTKKGVDAK